MAAGKRVIELMSVWKVEGVIMLVHEQVSSQATVNKWVCGDRQVTK
jgi:hypothetical protein